MKRLSRFEIFLIFLVFCAALLSAEPRLSSQDQELLDLVQKKTFAFFWEFAHPVSGMIPERNTTPEMVTTGGTGFGAMVWIVGAERGWLKREELLKRSHEVVDFLTHADRFHGAWPHWLNGATGKVIPFSTYDDGADLVETSFLMQGLLTLKAYFNRSSESESSLRGKISRLWDEIEWDWFTHGEKVLYWHWSPNYGWKMNLPIRGYNEGLITYILAASSRTHGISPEMYHQGWAGGNHFINGKTYFGQYKLFLGEDYGGPLFLAHYSFLGLDPRGLKDRYADYWAQNRNHSMINHLYCVQNPKNYKGYSDKCWGITASDNPDGYAAHSPTNDKGVIAPTAAVSSLPYTPDQSMQALRNFYSQGNSLLGDFGFFDALCPQRNWIAKSYLAIDQGPIVIMIENYRTGLLWRLFMQDQDVKRGLQVLGFSRNCVKWSDKEINFEEQLQISADNR